MKISRDKIDEIVKISANLAQAEVAQAKQQNTEMSEEDEKAISQKYLFNAMREISRMSNMGPKRAYRMGLLDSEGWRTGYTKPSLERRVADRRKKNKAARKARRANRLVAERG